MIRRKVKKPSRKAMEKKLWRIFSQYIRLRDADENGYCHCCSCGRVFHWKDMDAGHYTKRRHKATLFDERNVHAQCHWCNRYQDGANPEYAVFLRNTYGQDIIETLVIQSNAVVKHTTEELENMIAYYTKQVELLGMKP